MPYENEIQILSELRSEYSCFDPNEREYYHALSEAIRSLKTVDAERHGHWIECGWSIRCSECGYDMPWSVRNYCPNCGAEMKGDK